MPPAILLAVTAVKMVFPNVCRMQTDFYQPLSDGLFSFYPSCIPLLYNPFELGYSPVKITERASAKIGEVV